MWICILQCCAAQNKQCEINFSICATSLQEGHADLPGSGRICTCMQLHIDVGIGIGIGLGVGNGIGCKSV